MTSFPWTGDPDDELWCKIGDLSAHCECMSENAWYCGVYRPSAWEAARFQPSGSEEYRRYCLFHSSDSDILPLTASAAKRLCEMVMRLAIMEESR